MATLYTHAAVGLGLAKLLTDRPLPWSFWLVAAALPVVPDGDAFSPCSYGTMCGHRGFTHSWVFAAALAALAALLTFRYFGVKYWTLAAIFFACAASHAVLDALTNGG